MMRIRLIRRLAYLLLVMMGCMSFAAVADLAEETNPPPGPGAALKLPPGFKAEVFAKATSMNYDYYQGPRSMAFDSEGNLYLSLGKHNKVVMLPDRNRDGVADDVITVSEKLNAPQGLVYVNDKLLVANQDGIVALEKQNGKWPAKSPVPLIADLPTGGHMLKSLKLGPDGYLYLSVGSSCNVCVEDDPSRAAILRYSLDGKPAGALETVGRHAQGAIWASGLRNSQGFAWHPESGAMYATNNGSDMRSASRGGAPSDELPPEHLNLIEGGKHYGWPYCWGNQVPDPNFPGPEGFCATTQSPAITFKAHSNPIGITFLDKAKVPDEYKKDAIVALHGSWNRNVPSGYKLVRVKFDQGKPVEITDFATGWLVGKRAWGRPVDVVVGPEGALYVSDDRSGMVYRISYKQ